MFQRVMLLLAWAALLCAAPPEPARVETKSGLDAPRLTQIRPRMQSFVDSGEAPGIVTLVQRRGQLGHLEAVGSLDLEKKAPMRTDSIFEVMSMTKPVTAVGIQMLMEDGLLALNDPVEKYLPEFRGQQQIVARETVGKQERITLAKPARAITIRDLLTHTSGLQEMPPEGMGGVSFFYNMHRTLAEAVIFYSQQPLLFEPGAKWSYSNTGIATLGRIIEVVSRKPYETFLAERVFAPLGMKDSFFFPAEDRHSRIAHVYQKENGKLAAMGPVIFRKGARYPMPEGGLYSTAQDMAAFYQMMLNGGRFNGHRLLSKASVESMTMVHTANTSANWGLGWMIQRGANSTLGLLSEGTYSHGGAFGTYGWVDPVRQVVGVFMIQLFGPGVSPEIPRARFVEMANAAVID